MAAISGAKLFMTATAAEAVAALTERGPDGAPFAGGTWIMRAPIRGEAHSPAYVGIARIPELRAVEVSEREIRIGACVTHATLVAALASIDQCHGLRAAAAGAANPAIRQMATVGGNLSAWAFPASDLSPALLSLDASVELLTARGRERLPIDRFLSIRGKLEPGALVTGVRIPRSALLTGHARLPLRKAGDYPVAIVSVAAALGFGGLIEDIKVAVGSVEPSPRRWPELEAQLRGRPLDPRMARDLAEACVHSFAGRDDVEAPGWYRVQVLPTLVRRAVEAATLMTTESDHSCR